MSGSGAWSSFDPHPVRTFKRSEYHRMIELGLFQDEHVELIKGVLIKGSPQLAPHASTVQKLNQLLLPRLQGRLTVRIQSPLALSDDTEPEPDVAVVALGDYEVDHPSTALLIIEVSDTTLRKDRAKAAVYASAGISEYCIVNLGARTVEVYSSPDGDRYAEVRTPARRGYPAPGGAERRRDRGRRHPSEGLSPSVAGALRWTVGPPHHDLPVEDRCSGAKKRTDPRTRTAHELRGLSRRARCSRYRELRWRPTTRW